MLNNRIRISSRRFPFAPRVTPHLLRGPGAAGAAQAASGCRNGSGMTPLLGAVILAAGLAGCSERIAPPPALGNATSQNMAAQIVNPEGARTTGPVETNGAVVDAAVRRYVSGKARRPERVETGGSN